MNYTGIQGYLLLFLLFWIGCGQQEQGGDPFADISEKVEYDLQVQKEGIRLWADAGLNAEVLKTLPPGTKLKDLGQVSPFTTRIQLEGNNYYEPWVKVQTPTGETGWIYARLTDFQFIAGQVPKEWQHDKRLLAYFGPEKTENLFDYQQAFEKIRTLSDFAQVYSKAMELRESLAIELEKQTAELGAEQQPDLFWMAEEIPAFVPQLVAEGTTYYLFADYKQWIQKARQTPEKEDDSFIDFCLSIFPQDSVEYFFPVWQIQTWDYGGHSLLGRGHHFAALKKLDQLNGSNSLFLAFLHQWKQDLIDDITNIETTYWEDQSAVIAEVNQIIAAGFPFLTRDDKVALETRLKQFKKPDQYKIKFNYKSGLY